MKGKVKITIAPAGDEGPPGVHLPSPPAEAVEKEEVERMRPLGVLWFEKLVRKLLIRAKRRKMFSLNGEILKMNKRWYKLRLTREVPAAPQQIEVTPEAHVDDYDLSMFE